MATVAEVLSRLVEADDRLTAEYSTASGATRTWIDFCARVIEGIIKDIVRADLHSRTKQLSKLADEMKGSTEELKMLKATIESITKAGQVAQQTLNALSALLPLL